MFNMLSHSFPQVHFTAFGRSSFGHRFAAKSPQFGGELSVRAANTTDHNLLATSGTRVCQLVDISMIGPCSQAVVKSLSAAESTWMPQLLQCAE